MKRIFIIPFLLLLFSCDPDINNGRKLYNQYYFEVLKDPNSFKKLKELHYKKKGSSEIVWYLDYTANNSYGAAIREQVYFKTLVLRYTGSKYISFYEPIGYKKDIENLIDIANDSIKETKSYKFEDGKFYN
ncbi:hypothetical protein LLG07_04800 [bacterium]|nr:hypothetical protein [bacterium]